MAKRLPIRGYEYLEPIGAGAESVIYRARDVETRRIVAIKDIAVESREGRKYLRHVQNEYRVLKGLQSRSNGSDQGIVKVYRLIRTGFLRRQKRYALVMEYLEGLDLRRERRFSIGQMVDILLQIAEAVGRLHARNIVHGDLKPENVIVNSAGKATLVDFGFSCKAGSLAGSIRGTRDYMAPEQVNMGRITEKTDIYNLGATMYFLLTDRHIPALMPAMGDRSHFIVSQYMGPKPPRDVNPSIPWELSDLVLRCVELETVQRPSSMTEVISVLEDVRSQFTEG